MSLFARLAIGVLLSICAIFPAAAVQPTGSAAWTTNGWINYSGVLYLGPGVKYPQIGAVDEGLRIRVDRCSKLWCEIHTANAHGWLPLANISFGQGPWSAFVHSPDFPVRYGGPVCFYTGANFTGQQFCYNGGHVEHDLLLAGIDNSFSSVKIISGSAMVCRDRGFRSYCVIINESKPHLEGLLDNAISSIRVY